MQVRQSSNSEGTGGSTSVSRERAVMVGRHKQDFMQTRHEAQRNVGMLYVQPLGAKSVPVAQDDALKGTQVLAKHTERVFHGKNLRM